MKYIFTFLVWGMIMPFAAHADIATNIDTEKAYDMSVFVREGCGYCKAEKEFIEEVVAKHPDFHVQYVDLDQEGAGDIFSDVTKKFEIAKQTPISLIDGEVLVGFSTATTGKRIMTYVEEGKDNPYAIDGYLSGEVVAESGVQAEGCEDGSLVPCENTTSAEIDIPILGSINWQTTSLSFLAIVLGFVDGFNPCAMWVLLTFLLVLSQVGDKRKMMYTAGLFIIAEWLMYYLILNVWYQTWDFIALDQFVTPAIGLLAVGGGLYFINKYRKGGGLVCDTQDMESQTKTQNRIQELLSKPMSWAVAIGIIGVALSVNIIEFACSIGIPQAFTKVLELNQLSFLMQQAYMFLYTLFYMADDFIVFGLAIYGYQKFYAFGVKYSRLSTLIAGILMIILGIILLIDPSLIVFS